MSILDFILRERFITITVFGSIVTFQFLSTFKTYILDPILDFILSEHLFDFLNITIRDGVEIQKIDQKKLIIDFGQLLREFMKWIVAIAMLYVLSIKTNLQDNVNGNPGVAVM